MKFPYGISNFAELRTAKRYSAEHPQPAPLRARVPQRYLRAQGTVRLMSIGELKNTP